MMLEEQIVPIVAIGVTGYLKKFPSEGSNAASNDLGLTYPAKCAACQVAWASDATAMRKHRKECTRSKATDEMQLNYGIPRQYWFEVNYETHCLQVGR